MASKFGLEEPGSWTLAALDTETLSLRQSAVITEIGYHIITLPHISMVPCWRDYPIKTVLLKLDVLEQAEMGRHIDPKTVSWHEGLQGRDAFRQSVYGVPGFGSPFHYAADAIRIMIRDLRAVDEIWMNHPSFDQGRLKNLAEQLGIYDDFWHHQAEKDIATIRDTFGLRLRDEKGQRVIAAHTSVEDAQMNLQIYEQFARIHTPVWIAEEGYKWFNHVKVKDLEKIMDKKLDAAIKSRRTK